MDEEICAREMAWTRPLPGPSLLTEFYWRSGGDGLLRLMRCGACIRFHHPPSPRCPHCGSRGLTPEPVSGRGTVYAFTVNHHDWTQGNEDPFVYAVIELDDQAGLRVTGNVVGCPADAVAIGMGVEVRFVAAEDVFLPVFIPLEGASS